jgi:hypothetical protein
MIKQLKCFAFGVGYILLVLLFALFAGQAVIWLAKVIANFFGG